MVSRGRGKAPSHPPQCNPGICFLHILTTMVGKPPRVEVDGGTDVENVGVLALHQVRNT